MHFGLFESGTESGLSVFFLVWLENLPCLAGQDCNSVMRTNSQWTFSTAISKDVKLLPTPMDEPVDALPQNEAEEPPCAAWLKL